MNKTVKDTKKSDPNPVDIHVGQRLRMRRSLLGLSQEKLSDAIGLTFQQVQKYERGANRISASRLYQFSKILDVPIAYFFENYTKTNKSSGVQLGLSDNIQDEFSGEDVLSSKETIELIRIYYSIRDPKVRKDLLTMIKSMVESMSHKE